MFEAWSLFILQEEDWLHGTLIRRQPAVRKSHLVNEPVTRSTEHAFSRGSIKATGKMAPGGDTALLELLGGLKLDSNNSFARGSHE